MVSVHHNHSVLAAADIHDFATWTSLVRESYDPDEAGLILRACERVVSLYEGRTTATGAPLLPHALGCASILAGMSMDAVTLVAAILHAAPECLEDWKGKIAAEFGTSVCGLVEGAVRMGQLGALATAGGRSDAAAGESPEHAKHLESLRKMLLAMVQDIRVVLVKLAERTQALRELAPADREMQLSVAREVKRIFAPLANRLGVWQLKWELEDLSVRYLEPELYKQVARQLDERRIDRERYIAEFKSTLKARLAEAGIRAELSGRPKHIYSIINKMKRKGVGIEGLYDVRAVRALVDDVETCYAVLGVVHDLWQPVSGEFDDYIVNPKGNGYRSLHTAVIGPRGLPVEVQIRTYEMHQHSELGVAAHWRYKEGGKADAGFDEKIAWLRQILDWESDLAGLSEQFRGGLIQDRIYVLTPQGKIVDLPKGATPLDFAYALHTELGHRTRGAKVDGHIVPLGQALQNGQRVEILTVKQGGPSRDWLSPGQGYLKTSSARAKVRHWFRQQGVEDSIAQGRQVLERELQRQGIAAVNQDRLAQRLHFNKADELLAAIGRNELTSSRIAFAIRQEMPAGVPETTRTLSTRPAAGTTATASVLVEGVGNLMIRLAKCCEPAAPDAIVGYVTNERGITIHRSDCPFVRRVPESRLDRVLEAQWRIRNDR